MQEVRTAIAEAADPAVASALARYFQARPGGYGEGDVFVGVRLSRLRTLVAPYRSHPFVAADWLPLLTSEVHEHRLAALVIMAERAGRGSEQELETIYRTYLEQLDAVDNWDLVDVSAAPIVGHRLLDRDRAPLDELVVSSSVWSRRIAVVATHWFIRFGADGAGEDADIHRLARRLRNEPEDLVHKAVGWMLREAGLRVSTDRLLAFLDEEAARLPRTTLRYAVERLPPETCRHYLAQGQLPRSR